MFFPSLIFPNYDARWLKFQELENLINNMKLTLICQLIVNLMRLFVRGSGDPRSCYSCSRECILNAYTLSIVLQPFDDIGYYYYINIIIIIIIIKE